MGEIKLNPKYKPLYNSKERYFIITGGRNSGKSFGVTVFLLQLTYEAGHKVLFTRYTMTSAEKSIIPEFISKIEMLGVESHFEITKKEITNKLTGSSILFSGVQTSSGNMTASLKSIAGVTTWVLDEAEEMTNEDEFDTIDLSVRKKGIQNRVILIMNPSSKEHFVYGKFFESRGVSGGFNGEVEDCNYIHTTYLDNINNIEKGSLKNIERMKRDKPEKFKHVIMGGWLNRAEGVIFTDWEIGEFRKDSDSIFGQDYGFSNDPSTLIEGSICKKTKRIWLKEHVYEKGMTSQQLEHANRRYAKDNLIVCDNADPRLWQSLRATGLNMTPTLKFPDSINKGIAIMQDYHIIIDSKSVNLIKEFNNYAWKVKAAQGGKSVPIDLWNHCFVGDTLVSTDKGDVRIDELNIKNKILTRDGYKDILRIFNNGNKTVNKYSLKFDNGQEVIVSCTDNHKFKTTEGWKEIRDVQKGMTLYLDKSLTEEHTTCIKENVTTLKEERECIGLFGKTIMERYQKGIMFITKMDAQQITTLETYLLLKKACILGTRVKRGLKTIQSSIKTFTRGVSRKLRSGISQKKVQNGIQNTQEKPILKDLSLQRPVKNVVKNTKQDIREYRSIAITTAKLKQIDVLESYESRVYDIMVDSKHEYFANGVLVHNCIDAARYLIQYVCGRSIERGKYILS